MVARIGGLAPAILALALAAPAAAAAQAASGTGVVIRALDKLTGDTRDVTMPNAATARFGRMSVDHAECRYPAGNPSGDAYALLRVRNVGGEGEEDEVVFQGWMIASAPALNPLDHPRYDVWVLRCTTS